MTCYACLRPASQRCPRCNRCFCHSHGRGRCDHCRNPEHAIPSALLYRGALLLMFLSLGIGAWHLLAWPAFPAPAVGSAALLAAAAQPARPAETRAAPAEATPVPQPTPSPAPRRYTVEQGDTLLAIAQQFGVAMDAIIQANNLADPAALSIGQELVIP